MNRRKISAMLAVALITTQVQGVTFADTKNGNQENNKVNEVETCDFKNLDVSSLMDEKANAVISAYTDYNSLSSENIKKEKLNKYIGEDKSSISSITKNKKCAYSIYMDVDGGVDIDIYSIKDSDFLVIAYKDNKITYIEQRDCTNIVSGIQQNIN